MLTKEEKLETIKNVLLDYEESLSDGFCYYCSDAILDSDYEDDTVDEQVDDHLLSIAKEILEKIEE